MEPSLKNIFLADDDSDDVLFFEYALESLNLQCELTVSGNGEELLEKLKKSSATPDIIFLDINMPKVSGLDALEKIKGNPSLRATPVIVYSTCSNDDDIIRAYKGGASYFLVKPSDVDVLKNVVSKILSLSRKSFSAPASINQFVLRA